MLLPLAMGLHIYLFFGSGEIQASTDGWLYWQLTGNGLADPVWKGVLAGIFVFFQAVFINRLAIIHRLNNHINILPGFLWLFWSSMHPEMMGLSALHPALLCLLIGMSDLMACFKKRQRASHIFNTGFFFSLASLFYFPLGSALLFGLFMLFVFLSIRFPEPQQYLVGAFVPYFLAVSYSYYAGVLDSFVEEQWTMQDIGGVFSSWDLATLEWGVLALTILLLLIALINLPFYQAKKEIFSQRKISLLFYYLLFVLFGGLLLSSFSLSYLLLLLWPLTILLSDSLYQLRNPVLAELIIWVFIGFSFFMQYEFLF